VAGPASTDLVALYRGVAEASAAFGCPVVGGDLVNAADLVISVAVTGWCQGPPVPRGGARVGDEIWVTGPLGGSAAGLRARREGRADPSGGRHARPLARVAAGRAARAAGATAMIDVSDGLAADLNHVATASGVGVRLDDVPVGAGASRDEALGGGEDYELVFCAPAGAAVDEAFGRIDTPIRIGRCTDDPTERSIGGAVLPVVGWEHTWGPG
jgi:thiamine-monophosphate kinase